MEPDPAAWIGAIAGIVGALVAAAAAIFAMRSSKHARASIAIAERSERRQVERHDVFWEGQWVNAGHYVMMNRGVQDTAHNVTVIVDVDEEEKTAHLDAVEPGGQVELDFPEARAELRRLQQRQQEPTLGGIALHMPDFLSNRCFISERVTWTTALGVPRLYHRDFPNSSLGDVD